MTSGFGDGGVGHTGHAANDYGRELCATCGAPAYSGEMFCVSCGAYLGWDDTGTRAVVREQPTSWGTVGGPGNAGGPEGAPGPASVQPSWQQQAAPVPPLPSARSTPAAEGFGGAGPVDGQVNGIAPAVGDAGTGPDEAAAPGLLQGPYVPVPSYEDTASRHRTYAPVPRAVPCPACGTDNDATRHYCCPCGAELRPEPEPLQLTRWQRLRKQWDDRPRPWHMDRRWLLIPVVLPFCFALGMTAGRSEEAVRAVIPAVQDRFSRQVAVAPGTVKATSETNGYQASKSVDGVDNRAWAPAQRGQGAVGQSLTAQFPRPFRLTGLVVMNGASKQPKQYLAVGRPTRITAIAVKGDGTSVQRKLRLADQPGPQDFRWGVDDIVSVRLQISRVHAGLQPGTPVALGEVQFFTRQDT